jgi:serine/threonine protein kinase
MDIIMLALKRPDEERKVKPDFNRRNQDRWVKPELKRTGTERSAKPGASRFDSKIVGYTLVKKIGEGGQGKTEVVKRMSDNKILVRKEQKHFQMIITPEGKVPAEMYIFENIIGPTSPYSIIKFDHCNYTSQGLQTLYFEYCENGDVDRLVGKGIGECHIWDCFTQLADALAFLHYGHNRHSKTPPRGWQRVIHRDLKPANVFIRQRVHPTDKWQFVLGDFGLATPEEETSGCGTGEWIGPEVPKMTAKGDVWSLGAIIHAICHGYSPCDPPPKGWPGKSSNWYWMPQARNPKPLSSKYSDALNNEMFHCLTADPDRRYSSRALTQSLEKARRSTCY